MNKTAIIVIGIVVLIGIVLALKSFDNAPAESPADPTTSLSEQPATSSSALDKIEAAIRAKLKR